MNLRLLLLKSLKAPFPDRSPSPPAAARFHCLQCHHLMIYIYDPLRFSGILDPVSRGHLSIYIVFRCFNYFHGILVLFESKVVTDIQRGGWMWRHTTFDLENLSAEYSQPKN
jgi:hypothetical protein